MKAENLHGISSYWTASLIVYRCRSRHLAAFQVSFSSQFTPCACNSLQLWYIRGKQKNFFILKDLAARNQPHFEGHVPVSRYSWTRLESLSVMQGAVLSAGVMLSCPLCFQIHSWIINVFCYFSKASTRFFQFSFAFLRSLHGAPMLMFESRR